MAQHPPPSPFKVMAVNVNGLAAGPKRREFFASLQQQRQAVVLLSETHTTTDSQGQGWVREGAGPGRPWVGAAFFSSQAEQGQRAAGGVGVLIGQRLIAPGEEPVVEHQSPSGRVLKVSWLTPWGQRLAAVAVYAPCIAQQRCAFSWASTSTALRQVPRPPYCRGGLQLRHAGGGRHGRLTTAGYSVQQVGGGAGSAGGKLPWGPAGRMAAYPPGRTPAHPLYSRGRIRGPTGLRVPVGELLQGDG